MKDIPDDIQLKIEHIMQNFDFHKVHKAMEALEWRWGFDDEDEAPPITELRRSARTTLERAYQEELESTGTGGFMATYDKKDNTLSLRFEVCDWWA
jgi:hypothetical protein